MHITMVKKILADGSPCRKCAEVEQRLQKDGLLSRIDKIITADEREPESEGIRLAREYNVDRAPFFLVLDDDGSEKIYTVYFRFLKEVLQRDSSEQEEISELMDNNPDLDYL